MALGHQVQSEEDAAGTHGGTDDLHVFWSAPGGKDGRCKQASQADIIGMQPACMAALMTNASPHAHLRVELQPWHVSTTEREHNKTHHLRQHACACHVSLQGALRLVHVLAMRPHGRCDPICARPQWGHDIGAPRPDRAH
eukprot:964312-Pelagomonas_calceolata.AAC.2